MKRSALLLCLLFCLFFCGCDTGKKAASCCCTVSISCASVLEDLSRCKEEKRALIPQDGWILKPTEVYFHAGDSAFDVLKAVCREQGIPMEFEQTPLYHTAYIEGIANLYEFDVGKGSGWLYQVNGDVPNEGCSDYQIQEDDMLCWVYTCDYGRDLGVEVTTP